MSSLQSLAIKGNPLAQDELYRLATVAFVPSLIYVDFSMIMEEEVRRFYIKGVEYRILPPSPPNTIICMLSVTAYLHSP